MAPDAVLKEFVAESLRGSGHGYQDIGIEEESHHMALKISSSVLNPCFCALGAMIFWISSSSWMARNLSSLVSVLEGRGIISVVMIIFLLVLSVCDFCQDFHELHNLALCFGRE